MVPSPENFAIVANEIRARFEKTEGILGATLCGSILGNGCNFRSDIDCVVIYDPNEQREVAEVMHDVGGFARDLNVPTEFIPLDPDIAGSSVHHIVHSFAVHLGYAAKMGGVIKTNPLEFFNLEHADANSDIHGYLRNKLRRLEKGIAVLPMMSEEELHRFLQKVLEAPVQIARKMLWWCRVETQDDSKQTVMRRYPEIASEQELALFLRVTTADRAYTDVVAAQLEHPDRDRYAMTVEELKEVVWATHEFVRLTALRIA